VKHTEALDFLRPADIRLGDIWAELGAGTGTFAKALLEFVGKTGTIHAVDRDQHVLSQLTQNNPAILTHHQDFTQPLTLKNLDGILMANSLHFVRHQSRLLGQLLDYLKPTGKFVIIEYDIIRANPWVPFPVSFEKLKELASGLGFTEPVRVATRPSSYHREIYVAVITLKSTS
jgi:ubiquinone/menaquinone biosynthesis C-methylase UbiE